MELNRAFKVTIRRAVTVSDKTNVKKVIRLAYGCVRWGVISSHCGHSWLLKYHSTCWRLLGQSLLKFQLEDPVEKHTSEKARERGLVSRNPSHTGARVLRTASAVIKLCLGRVSEPFANPKVRQRFTFYIPSLHRMPYAAKAKTRQFTGRKPNLMRKADQLARFRLADVALVKTYKAHRDHRA